MKEVVEHDFKGAIEFLAQNVATADFGDPVFKPWTLREVNGVPVAIIGQAFPYTPIANPRYFVAEWTFGIQEEALQKHVEAARAKGAAIVVLLSHNGMDVDLKLASRVRGIDAILGGHTHDAVPQAGAGRQRGRHDARHQRRQQRQVPRRAGLRRAARAASVACATACCRSIANLLPAGPGDAGAHRGQPRASRQARWPRSSRSPSRCSTGAATSTARRTS